MNNRSLTITAGLAMLLLTACSSTIGGQPSSTTPSPSNSGTDNPSGSHASRYGAPTVPSPLDVEELIHNPCSALSSDQIDTFPDSLDESEVAETTTFSDKKTSCNWFFQGKSYSYGSILGGVALPRDKFHGLSSIYKSHEDASYETFEPLKAAGYPAVVNNESD